MFCWFVSGSEEECRIVGECSSHGVVGDREVWVCDAGDEIYIAYAV